MRWVFSIFALLFISGTVLFVNGETSEAADTTTTVITTIAHNGTTANGGPAVSPTGGSTGGLTGATGGAVSTVIPTTVAPTTTQSIDFNSVTISNELTILDAEYILQEAVQLNNQIQNLILQINQAGIDTDPSNSPLFGQLNDILANATTQNAVAQGYITTLQSLSTNQDSLEARANTDDRIFSCFASSQCVRPTTPGPTLPPHTCNDSSPATATNVSQTYSLDSVYNANCNVKFNAPVSTYQLALNVSVTINGNGYVLLSGRSGNAARINQTGSTTFSDISYVDVKYYSDSRSSISFKVDYLAQQVCSLSCNTPNGHCEVSQSGAQYCVCNCGYSGDNCETFVDPCQTKQKRACGENKDPAIGYCVPNDNTSADQCFKCTNCTFGNENDQKCKTAATFNWLISPDLFAQFD